MTVMAKGRSNIRRAFGLGGSMAGVRLVCSFLSIKITAIYLGPAGLALVAQFANFVTLWQSMLATGLGTGVVRLSSEYGNDPARRRLLLSTALRLGLAMTAILAVVLLAASPFISQWLLSDRKYVWLIAITGIAVAAMVFNDLLASTLTAVKEIGLVAGSNMVSTIAGLAIFLPCCMLWGVEGGLIGSFTVYIATFLITAITVRTRSAGVKFDDFRHGFDRGECKRILGFYPMLIVNGVLPPLVLITVRDSLVSSLSLDSAGLWQATWRLSEAYQMVITSSMSLYFMARMGEVVDFPVRLRREVWRTLGAVIGITGVMALGIFVLREWIVHVVFSPAFIQVADLLPLQLAGDVLRMGAWILSMVLVALVRSRWFIVLTVIVGVVYAGAAKLLIPSMGIEGAIVAYLISGVTHMLLAGVALRDILFARAKDGPASTPAPAGPPGTPPVPATEEK